MTQYNMPMNFIAAHWLTDFTSMVDALRVDLGLLNANLPVVLGVQRIAGRERVYPLMGIIKEQQQALNMSNLLKVQMEVRGGSWRTVKGKDGTGGAGGRRGIGISGLVAGSRHAIRVLTGLVCSS